MSKEKIIRTRGIVTFSNVVMELPAHTPVPTLTHSIYRNTVQLIRLVSESKSRGGFTPPTQHYFQLAMNLSALDNGYRMGNYATNNIDYTAEARELKYKLQALPHVGQVDVTKSTRNHPQTTMPYNSATVGIDYDGTSNYTEWAVTFLHMDDDVPLMTLRENGGNADIVVQEIVAPKHYKLDVTLNDPLSYYPSRGFRLDDP